MFSREKAIQMERLAEQLNELQVERDTALERLASVLPPFPNLDAASVKRIVLTLAENADAVRDALDPFDSGVRVRDVPEVPHVPV